MLNDLRSQFGNSVHTVRNFLERPLRMENGLVTLGQSPRRRRAEAREARKLRERPLKLALYELMERHPESRRLMRHLDLVERTLRRGGLAALQALPVRVVAKALAQLERLVWDWSPAGLAELRSRMAVMVKTRSAEAERQAEREAAEFISSSPSQADISEVDHATFEEMERSWTGRAPAGAAPERAAA